MSGHASVAIIGVGAMGNALLSGLLRAGWEAEDISLCVRRMERGDELAHRTGCEFTLDPTEAVRGRQVIVVAVKPRDVEALLETLEGNIEPGQLVLSLAAGITTGTYEKYLGAVPVIRAMPNTPALVGEGVTGIAAGAHSGLSELDTAREILDAVGSVRMMDESLLDAVTAVSGTGPAYVFLLAEALTEAAIREGLPATSPSGSLARRSRVQGTFSPAPTSLQRTFDRRSRRRVAPQPPPSTFWKSGAFGLS